MIEKGYKKLIVWQKADQLAHHVYLSTNAFPKEETYGLKSQIRRAAISVAVNLVEGYGRQSRKELKQFVNIALGSLAEVDYFLDFSFRLQYLTFDKHSHLQNLRQEVGRRLWRFYKCL